MTMLTVPKDESAMSDPVLSETAELKAWTVPVSAGDAPSFMERVLRQAAEAGTQVMVARADMVFGKDHLRSALYHAKRALREGSNASDSLAMETLLYASGERQLSSAIKKMSVDGGTLEVVVAAVSDGRFVPGPSWRALDDSPGEAVRERLSRFGIGAGELETVAQDKALELVLEKVASVDILKK